MNPSYIVRKAVIGASMQSSFRNRFMIETEYLIQYLVTSEINNVGTKFGP